MKPDPSQPPGEQRRLRTIRPALEIRARLIEAIRSFFHERGFLEIETPVRLPAPAAEPHIEPEPSGAWYLRTSPELHMKRLLAAGYEKIFQIGPCFRRGEAGRLHHPEYTLLEWYRAGTDYRGILEDTRQLVRHIARSLGRGECVRFAGVPIALGGSWNIQTVSEAFLKYAGWDPCRDFDPDRFDLDLVEKVEPALPADRPSVLLDYPAARAALARLKPGDPSRAERWELYIGGLELANAYSELTHAEEQRRRFNTARSAAEKAGRDVPPLDETFLESMAALPPCGGIALGIDRLAMLFTGAEDIGEVMAFREGARTTT